MKKKSKVVMHLIDGVILVAVLIGLVVGCSRSCSGGGDDDRWDYLQHQVDTDPYYDQW